MRDFKELKVWRQSHALTSAVYKETASFTKGEVYGLTRQICRSAVSIGAHIAKGCGESTRFNCSRFLEMALGSASDLEYELLLASALGFMNHDHHDALESQVVETKRMLADLIEYLDDDQMRRGS